MRADAALVLCGLQLLNLVVAEGLEERRRVLVFAIRLVVGKEFEDCLALAVADAGVRLVHHALYVALPLIFGHRGVDGAGNGVALRAFVGKHLVPLLLRRRIAGDIGLVWALV